MATIDPKAIEISTSRVTIHHFSKVAKPLLVTEHGCTIRLPVLPTPIPRRSIRVPPRRVNHIIWFLLYEEFMLRGVGWGAFGLACSHFGKMTTKHLNGACYLTVWFVYLTWFYSTWFYMYFLRRDFGVGLGCIFYMAYLVRDFGVGLGMAYIL